MAQLTLEITNRCNFNCIFCSPNKQRSNDTLEFEKCIEVLNAIKEYNIKGNYVNTVQFSGGGEPLLHKRLIEIISEAKKRFNTVEIITNGYLLSDKKSEEILNTNIDMISISLTGIIPEVYSKFQGSGLDFEKANNQMNIVISNIISLCKKKKELHKKTIIRLRYIQSKESKEHLKQYIKFWKAHDVDEVFITQLYDFKRTKGSIRRCHFAPRRIQVLASGEVIPCVCNFGEPSGVSYGNILQSTFEEVVSSNLYINTVVNRMSCDINRVPKTCLSCENRRDTSLAYKIRFMKKKVFLHKPFKTFIYELYGPLIIVFDYLVRLDWFYNLFLLFLRKESQIRRKQLTERLKGD